uniref:Uncharacterized protein n=1 Tax=Anopheles funestus TaxID=62324 RepID=A0A182S175_ANOFN
HIQLPPSSALSSWAVFTTEKRNRRGSIIWRGTLCAMLPTDDHLVRRLMVDACVDGHRCCITKTRPKRKNAFPPERAQ